MKEISGLSFLENQEVIRFNCLPIQDDGQPATDALMAHFELTKPNEYDLRWDDKNDFTAFYVRHKPEGGGATNQLFEAWIRQTYGYSLNFPGRVIFLQKLDGEYVDVVEIQERLQNLDILRQSIRPYPQPAE